MGFSHCAMRVFRLVLLTVLWIPTGCLEIGKLEVGKARNKEVIRLDEETKTYRLVGLRERKSYEVRVSYPATIPSHVTLEIINGHKEGSDSSPHVSSRKLLNVEKIIFDVASLHPSKDDGSIYVQMRAQSAGVRPLSVKEPQQWLIYNIVLEEVIWGIPVDAIPIIIMGVCLILVSFVFTRWWTRRPLNAIVDWLTESDTAKQRVA